MSKKILIVDRVHPLLVETLSERGYLCETNQTLTHNQFVDLPDTYYGLIIRSRFPVDKVALSSKPNLRFVLRIGSGVEHIDIDYAKELGICCLSTPEGNAGSVAEHCLGMLIAALKNIPIANNEVRQGNWLREKNKGSLIETHTIGIIGYGNTGPAFAKMLAPFGCTILAYDIRPDFISDSYCQKASLDEILEKCDVISIHINYTPENHYFVNSEFLNRWKNPFILINSSRGQVLNCDDLLLFVTQNKLHCACLDVLEYENVKLQIPEKEQWTDTLQKMMENKQFIITPHIAGQTTDAERKHALFALEKIFDLER